MRYRVKAICALLLLLLLPSCATMEGGQGLNIVSRQEEIQLGQKLSTEVDKDQQIVQDPVLEEYVSQVGQRIARVTNQPDLPYTFKVIEKDEVNAFSLPGGPVYVYTGLLKTLDNEAELAGVLGHEIAHITARHATEQLTRTYGLELLSEVLLGKNPSAAAQLASNVGGTLGLLHFSRSDEIEADQLGVEYMFRAGYNPTAMIDVERKLAGLQKTQPSRVANLLSTHPMSQQRIDAIAQEIAKLPSGRDVGYFPERYKQNVSSHVK